VVWQVKEASMMPYVEVEVAIELACLFCPSSSSGLIFHGSVINVKPTSGPFFMYVFTREKVKQRKNQEKLAELSWA
jgi:hypothetical protein